MLVPADAGALLAGVAPIRLPAPPPPPPVPDGPEERAVAAAASLFDPWEGAPRAYLTAVAGLERSAADAAVDRLVARGLLRSARDATRVLPTIHAFQARPAPTDPAIRAHAERFVLTLAAACTRAGDAARIHLADDRANLMTALALWPDVGAPELVEGFAVALPFLLDDAMCRDAARLVIEAAPAGSPAARRLAEEARVRIAET